MGLGRLCWSYHIRQPGSLPAATWYGEACVGEALAEELVAHERPWVHVVSLELYVVVVSSPGLWAVLGPEVALRDVDLDHA